jgi:DHA1 family bicyclomycin/chloramphenicol resistance-like MFS transporter
MPRAIGFAPTVSVLLVGYFALQPLATDLYLASLPSLPAVFATDAERAQQTLTLFMAAFGVAQLVAGPLSDRFGRRPVLTAGVAVFALASALALVVTSIDAFIALRVAQAAVAACCIVAGRALVRDRFEPVAGAPLLAAVTAWTASLSVVGPILGGYLEAWAGYRGSFVVMTVFAVVLLAVHLRRGTESLRHPPPIAPGALARGVGQTLRDGCFWAFTLAACAWPPARSSSPTR